MDTLHPLKTREAIFAQVRRLMKDPVKGLVPLYQLYPTTGPMYPDPMPGHGIAQGPWILEAYAALGFPPTEDPGIARGKAAWVGWETFTDRQLLETNIAFIKNEIGWTPYHPGPLYMEQAPVIPYLVTMHEYGFFTFDGSGAEDTGVMVQFDRVCRSVTKSDICFYARDGPALRRFFAKMAASGVKYYFRTAPGVFFCNFMAETITTTVGKDAPNTGALKKTPWGVESSVSIERISDDASLEILDMSNATGWALCVVVGDQSVEPIIVRAIKAAGVPRVIPAGPWHWW